MERLEAWPDIYSAALDCDLLFKRWLIQVAEPRTTSHLGKSADAIIQFARDYHEQFEAWSSYLGVFAEQGICLDHRLSKSEKPRNMITGQLGVLFSALQHQDGTPERVTRSSTRILNEKVVAAIREQQEYVEDAITNLRRMQVSIRAASAGSLIPRMRAYSADRSDSYLKQIALSMVKFLYPTAPLNLQRLLGRSILERHFKIRYRVEHQQCLKTHRLHILDKEDNPRVHDNGPELISRKDYVDDAFTVALDDSGARIEPELSKPECPALSSVSRAPSLPKGDISYPEPPKPLGDGNSSWATCCWCSESHPYRKFEDTRWWERHVDHDLQPYVCLVDTCSGSSDTFDGFNSWYSSQTKRKRGAKRSTPAKLNASSRAKRKKTHLQDEAQAKDYESMSSDESDLEPVNRPGAELISPQLLDQPRRKEMLQHIARHLKALSFMSLRFNTFCEQPRNEDQNSATRDEREDLSKIGEPSGTYPEIDALSFKFSNNPISLEWSGTTFTSGFKSLQQVSTAFNYNERVDHWLRLSNRLDISVSNSADIEVGNNASSAFITPLEYIPNENPTTIQSNSWIQSVELFVQKSITPNKLNDGLIKILLIDQSADVSHSVSKVQQPEESPVRQDMRENHSNNVHGSLMAQMIHRICPHVKLFRAKSGEIDQTNIKDRAERAAKAIEWAIEKGVQIILLTGYLVDSKENTTELTNLGRQIQQAAAANILLYCAAADWDSYSGGTEPHPHKSDIGPIRVVGSATDAGRVSQFVNPQSVHYLFPGEITTGVDDLKDNSVATAVAAGFAGLILWCFAYQHPGRAENDYKGPNADEMHKIFKALQKKSSKWVDVTTLFKKDGSAAIQNVVDYCYTAGGNRRKRGRRGISPVA
ncbi:hypothetical protein TrVFT333_010362 [Trichoderma virens FT-333]|nr:hypothetical protein TrVFT333_010362 [Trichoderma virens FT-333]